METWHIVLIVALVGIILYLAMRKNTLPVAPPAVAAPIQAAPGVSQATGQVLNNPAPPPPSQTTGLGGSITSAVMAARPSNVMQHIPVVGGVLAASNNLARQPVNIALGVTDKVNSSVAHIPVVGKALAAPGKAINSALKSIGSFF